MTPVTSCKKSLKNCSQYVTYTEQSDKLVFDLWSSIRIKNYSEHPSSALYENMEPTLKLEVIDVHCRNKLTSKFKESDLLNL
jgi:hypothetical protein